MCILKSVFNYNPCNVHPILISATVKHLSCPLCCNETFATSSSLKCHILEILDNLICPTCQEKFEKLSELAEHLENDCVETLICSGNDVEEVATKNEEG
jgi:hypothetical protein